MKKKLYFLLAVLVYILLAVFIVMQVADSLDFSFLISNKSRLISGAALTVGMSLAAVVSSMVVGFILFLMIQSENTFIKSLAEIYKEIIMGTPLLVLVFVTVYIIGVAFAISRYKLFLGFLALSLYMSPYMTNIFEGAYKSIDVNQLTVMDFYGFNMYQKYKYIILPQMVRPSLPGLINNLSGIIKGTSILSTIAISEIFYTTSVLSNTSYRYVEGYFILWLIYLLITIPLSRLAKYLSRQENY